MNLLKITFLLFFIIPAAIMANDGYLNVYFDNYTEKSENPEFKDQFDSESDKRNFKKLREFLNEKHYLETTISMELDDLDYYKLRERVGSYDEIISGLEQTIKKFTGDTIELDINEYEKYFENENYDDWRYYDEKQDKKEFIKVSKNDIKERIIWLEERIVKYETREKQLSDNLRHVKSDIYDCESQIDYALAPEYERQKFRKAISMYFALLIGFLLAAFFIVVYRKSDNKLSSSLLSGNGLQFITLFVLIIAIILFGILGVLEGRELAAILSGISGYILGKGIKEPELSITKNATPKT
jgi:hypothetical protein